MLIDLVGLIVGLRSLLCCFLYSLENEVRGSVGLGVGEVLVFVRLGSVGDGLVCVLCLPTYGILRLSERTGCWLYGLIFLGFYSLLMEAWGW